MTQPAPGDTLTPEERRALRFAADYQLWAQGFWHVVNSEGYESVPMTQEVAEQSVLLWPAPADRPYRAEPLPRPVLPDHEEAHQ